ncbi:putative zinc-type alcohol dehydrogenase-like protein [Rhodococcus rhodochrous J45]|uniref:alcohol dehydrogenase (NADP(+)) n=1 Tax=Rhodococcus rhodochrous J45 TaxID=935266 RepID=A0A562DH88_RHORH|nr:NAD(P)-dependent alcohol dehydrogenase [Rhodococcus rhodochrous]TWH08967.1 putative zinc-type alcohol dehydrogenase-like protein [Rhodococcus rhodochrous J45]
MLVNARSTAAPGAPFEATKIERRDVGPNDVLIDIAYAGICHTDVSRARSEFGKTHYPLVPGHEIAGIVSAVGDKVTKFAEGDRVGIGCFVDSCRECDRCKAGLEPYCRVEHIRTYNAVGRDGKITQGGYSEKIVVDEGYVLRIPDSLPLHEAAPLLCAGITTYTPLRHWKAGPDTKVAIVGFGGLGHVGVSISKALGAHTTVLDLDPDKEADALRRGADAYRLSTDPTVFTDYADTFDLIVSTVPANLDYDAFLQMLTLDGTFVNLGVPHEPIKLDVFSLLHNRRSIAGTLVGGIAETQEMLDFCAEHGINAEVEVIDADSIDRAYDRVAAGDVKYRFVIDISTMATA